jgi:hypothetical protein
VERAARIFGEFRSILIFVRTCYICKLGIASFFKATLSKFSLKLFYRAMPF